MKHFRFPTMMLALFLGTAFGVSSVDAAVTPAQSNTVTRVYMRNFNRLRRVQPGWKRGAAGREAARKQQMKKDQAKEAKELQAASDEQAEKDAQAIKDAQSAAKTAPAPNQQSKKIAPNILKGGLRKDDLDTLDKRTQLLDDLQKSLAKDDAKLSHDELKSLFDAVGLATQSIWAARQSTGAAQTKVYRLGASAFVKSEFATRLLSGELTRSEARQIARDFQQLLAVEKDLVTADSTPDARSKTQGQYSELLSKYFESRD